MPSALHSDDSLAATFRPTPLLEEDRLREPSVGRLAAPPSLPSRDYGWGRRTFGVLLGVVVLAALIGRGERVPILVATEPWEEGAVYEPSVRYESGYQMWYTGGWDHPAMGYATSPDGIRWTKHGRVFGQGTGVQGTVARVTVIRSGLLYLYYADANPDANLRVATSEDGIHWSPRGIALAKDTVSWSSGWANTTVWREGRWRMLLDARTGSLWQVALASSDDGLTWKIDAGPLTSLQVAPGGTYGGAHLAGTEPYTLWYQATPVAGDLPTDLYRSTSSDLVSWTTPERMLTHQGSGFEVDQVADPDLAGGFLFYDGDDNPNARAAIGAVFTSQ